MVAIAGLLLAVGVISIANLRISTNLSAASDVVRITLEKARLSSLVKEDGSGYSLKFNNTDLVLFKGATYNSGSLENKTVGLPAGVEITSINLEGGGSTVSFSNLTGTTTAGSITLSSISDPTKTKIVYINGSGQVLQNYTPAGSGGGGGSGSGGGSSSSQTIDTGHQNFNLGWSIQTTSELQFKFLNDPNNIQTFIMEPHFNGDRSVFNYVGNFTSGGVNQTIRIYSNQINNNNTILSVTRDPIGINLPLEISIDGRVIVTYLADGTMSVGAFGGTVIGQ